MLKESTRRNRFLNPTDVNNNNEEECIPTPDQSSPTVIIGDSLLKRIDIRRFRRSLGAKSQTSMRTFPGATFEDTEHYAKPPIMKQSQIVIIHAGTNDIPNANQIKL